MHNGDNIEEQTSDKPSDLPSLQIPYSPTGSPPRQRPLSDMLEVEHCVANLTLAHEIVVNADFRFRQNNPPKDSLEGRVKEMVHQAFWDSLQAQLCHSPPDYTHAISLLEEVKNILQSLLLPGHVRLRAQMEEALDIGLIRQQAKHGALDLHRLGNYIVTTMASLCAPIRDPEVRQLRVLSDPVDLLREIFRVLGLMKMDMVNFTMQSLRPHLLQQAIQYERAKFQAILDRQPDSLDNTTSWLQGAAQELASDSLVVPPKGSSAHSTFVVSPSATLTCAYMRLLSWDSENHCYPETVQMDRARLESLGQVTQHLVLQAAVLLVTSTHCEESVFSRPGFVVKLKQAVAALLEGCHNRRFDMQGALLSVGEQVKQLVNDVLMAQGGTALTLEREGVLKAQLAGLAKDQDPVRILIGARVRGFLKATLAAPTTQGAPPVPPALVLVAHELAELGVAFQRIVRFNQQVFGPFYSSILKKLLFPQGAPEMGLDSR
ncbi:T-complex protein 11-like protein 1 [Paramormyrops kingsleyae]|uniref:T-complex 11 family, X-linked 1 n=1 Tax=Paramormyrops kingsleyae TaxID=1676925 RepID=A0A3B3QJV8_9TELE|nr:T-complex protein 11 homolog [Paramormyrops kingsleyae]